MYVSHASRCRHGLKGKSVPAHDSPLSRRCSIVLVRDEGHLLITDCYAVGHALQRKTRSEGVKRARMFDYKSSPLMDNERSTKLEMFRDMRAVLYVIRSEVRDRRKNATFLVLSFYFEKSWYIFSCNHRDWKVKIHMQLWTICGRTSEQFS